jgi:hypothetical protein
MRRLNKCCHCHASCARVSTPSPGRNTFLSLCCLVLMAIVIPARTLAQASAGKDITLTTSSGTKVLVPSSGALANDSAQQVALDVLAIDRQLKSKPGKRPGDSDVGAAMQQMAADARNDAVDSLDLAYRVAEKTSGILDSGQIDSAKQNVQIAKLILNTAPPARLFVRTAISSTVTGATLHYWDAAEYKKKTGSWSSYTPGEQLHIGRYLFRVDGVNGGEPYQELVLILSDPTEKVISPLR